MVTQHVAKSIEVVVELRDDTKVSPKDRLTAAFWLAGLAGIVPVTKNETALISKTAAVSDSLAIEEFRGKSPEELMRFEQAHRERRVG